MVLEINRSKIRFKIIQDKTISPLSYFSAMNLKNLHAKMGEQETAIEVGDKEKAKLQGDVEGKVAKLMEKEQEMGAIKRELVRLLFIFQTHLESLMHGLY